MLLTSAAGVRRDKAAFSSGCKPQLATIPANRQCRLWVISGQTIPGQNPPLSAVVRKRTFWWDTRGKRRNDPVEGFGVPLFAKPLFLRRWWGPLGTAMNSNDNFQFVARASFILFAESASGATRGYKP